jgi:hypothetical protein
LKLYSYIVTRDFGFAPNPFPPACTLATCKPKIRQNAQIEDWIVGIGSGAQKSQFKNKLIYAMQVQEKLEFDDYWIDPRFKKKRPIMNGSKRQMYGDNIYHRPSTDAPYVQEDSHHSLPGGQRNELNYNRDLPGKYVLISNKFWYYGQEAILLPENFLFLTDVARGYRVIKEKTQIESFIRWLASLSQSEYIGRPYMFRKEFERYAGKN